MSVPRAPLEKREHGLAPASDGWFVVHVTETAWSHDERFGRYCLFEDRERARFPEIGVNLHVLEPGKPACMYHREDAQEDFLVLSGECRVLIEEEEIPLRAGHFVHCPAGATHVFVGTGEGPCAVLMIGRRPAPGEREKLFYPASELAATYGASAAEDTAEPREAYAGSPPSREVEPPGRLPW